MPLLIPWFESSNENIGIPLVIQVLEGDENYITWKKSVVRSLGIKIKLGFIYGRFPKPNQEQVRKLRTLLNMAANENNHMA